MVEGVLVRGSNSEAAVLDFECVPGSHVYVNTAEGEDFYSEWGGLTPETQRAFTQVRDSLSRLTEKVRDSLYTTLTAYTVSADVDLRGE